MHAANVPVIDTVVFGGTQVAVPASVAWSMEWRATGPFVHRGSGKSTGPSDANHDAFDGNFAFARATGTFTGRELGFSFKSDPGVSTDKGWAEMGFEKNGSFIS